MLGFLFILLVIFVLAQRKRYLMRYWHERWGGRLGPTNAASGSSSSKASGGAGDKDYWFERGAREAERYARKLERNAERFERGAKRFERNLKYGLGSHAGTEWCRFAASAPRQASAASPSPVSAE